MAYMENFIFAFSKINNYWNWCQTKFIHQSKKKKKKKSFKNMRQTRTPIQLLTMVNIA